MEAATLPPDFCESGGYDARDAEGDRDVGEIERDLAVDERIRDTVAPGHTAHVGRERAAGGDARSQRERQRSRPGRKPDERRRDRRAEHVDQRRPRVREHARLQSVVDDRRGDDRERSDER